MAENLEKKGKRKRWKGNKIVEEEREDNKEKEIEDRVNEEMK
jgi:hypothetical protein